MVKGPFLVDGHVHYYSRFDRDVFFNSALANFRSVQGVSRTNAEYAGWLLFAESAGMNYFRRFQASVGRDLGGQWAFRQTDETGSLIARHRHGSKLLLIAGRQVVTAEQLEVLTLCCETELSGGRTLPAVVEAAQALNAIVVLPWGFGKWWFRRGTRVRDFIRMAAPADIFVGDNGGRAGLVPRPRFLRIAASRGIRTLSGSDPLPLESEVKRIGRYGFVVDGTVDVMRPAHGLKWLLKAGGGEPLSYGRFLGPVGFWRNQLMIRSMSRRSSLA